MKIIAHILIYTILLSSVQFVQAAQSFHDSFPFHSTEVLTCDTAESSCCEVEEDQHDHECCTGNDCECSCCLHIVYINFIDGAFAQNFPIFVQKYNWEFNYHKDFLSGIFHPPLA